MSFALRLPEKHAFGLPWAAFGLPVGLSLVFLLGCHWAVVGLPLGCLSGNLCAALGLALSFQMALAFGLPAGLLWAERHICLGCLGVPLFGLCAFFRTALWLPADCL